MSVKSLQGRRCDETDEQTNIMVTTEGHRPRLHFLQKIFFYKH